MDITYEILHRLVSDGKEPKGALTDSDENMGPSSNEALSGRLVTANTEVLDFA